MTDELKLTDAQRTAIYTHDRDVMVVAGAGSGKTFVLVERYLALLERHRAAEVVAITFTNKAAREMRGRVRAGIMARAAAQPDNPLWRDRLTTLDSARIETIHALCGAILRASAAEAGIDPDFAVLEEADAGLLKEAALDRALRDLAAADDPALALAAEYGEARLRDALFGLLSAELLPAPDDFATAWRAAWDREARPALDGLAQSGFPLLLASLPPEAALTGRLAESVAALRALAAETPADLAADVARLRAMRDTIRLPGGRLINPALIAAKDALQGIREQLDAYIKDIPAAPNTPLDEQSERLLPLWWRLVAAAKAAYAHIKRDRAALDFDDLESMTRRLLRDQPSVQRRYRAEFAHLLVDEFQDTNQAQWEIVQALARPGCTFLVGDPKQSIYAFRGADVSVFAAAQAAVRASGGVTVDLAESFRTHRRLVADFNTLFGGLLIRDALRPAAYQVEYGVPMRAERLPPADAPSIVLHALVYSRQAGGDAPDDRAEARRRREARLIAERLAALVGTLPIYDRELKAARPAAYGDMALLFRRMTHVTLYEEAFKALGIPFVTLAGRGYYDRQEVWDALNLLRALYTPADDLALAAVLRSPLFNLSDEALLALRLFVPNGTLWEALAQDSLLPEAERERVAFACKTLAALRGIAGRVTIAELLREAMARTGYLAALTALPDGARRRGNVEKLLAKARDGGKMTLGAFTRYLDDLSEREVREGEASLEVTGAVRLMTIHASKGLEFPIVAIVDIGAEAGGRDGALLALDPPSCRAYDADAMKIAAPPSYELAQREAKRRDDAESRRLFYVALTRAADHLILTGQIQQSDAGARPHGWMGWLCQAFGLSAPQVGQELTPAPPWDGVRVHVHDAEPPEVDAEATAPDADPFALLPEDTPTIGLPPALLATPRVEPGALARSLTATQIADLGCAFDVDDPDERSYFRRRWRRDVLRESPDQVVSVKDVGRRIQARVRGEIVHRALRWWRADALESEWRERLDAYAWEEGVLDADARDKMTQVAMNLLLNVLSSPVHQRMARARQVYRELPFIYRTEKRTIYGVIDALMLTAEGRWQVVDYKTAYVPREMSLEAHARRYWLQVAVYAAAAMQLIDVLAAAQGQHFLPKTPPEVYIHYIRYMQTVKIEAGDWQRVLDRLEPCIGDLMRDDN
jgi:ATP-dependent helicase/nuclease subunit A